ncbi:MAG: recombinase family protein, partial [Acidobacteria bacterium]|nr:recombinase family protein [Acidobacteriota bacterium]
MNKDDLPTYDESEQGVDQDFHEVPASTAKRRAAAARFDGGRASLIAKLQGDSEMPHKARSRAQQVAKVDEKSSPLRAVCYLRVSTEEQARVGGTAEGYSIPYQRRACLQKADELGATVVQEYTDLGESAKSALRPGLQRMLKELLTLGAQLVIVHKIDRLARNTRDDYEINGAIA